MEEVSLLSSNSDYMELSHGAEDTGTSLGVDEEGAQSSKGSWEFNRSWNMPPIYKLR